jgi:hypothetical protein
MARHAAAAAFFASSLLIGIAALLGLAHFGADRAQPGDTMLALFPRDASGTTVIASFEAAGVRRFEPLGTMNAWMVEAGAPGVAQALRERGALLVVREQGTIPFVLGCITASPVRDSVSLAGPARADR